MSFKTDYARVAGLGAARHGVAHWWAQRVTAVALIPLTALAVIPFSRAVGAGHEAVLATYGHPFHAIVAILFLAVAFRHLHQGLQVVIEDYVHGKAARTAALLGNTMFCALFGLIGAFGVGKIAFAA